jgi:hypothetical protein
MFKDCVGHLPTESNISSPYFSNSVDKKKARDNLHVTLAKNVPQESVLFSHKREQGQTVFLEEGVFQ